MAISTIGSDGLATSAVTSTKLASGVPSRSQLPAGTVLQVVQGFNSGKVTATTTTLTSMVTSTSITPTSSTSKIAIFVSTIASRTGSNGAAYFVVYRGSSTSLLQSGQTIHFGHWNDYSNSTFSDVGWSYVDSPATTSPVSYQIFGKTNASGSTAVLGGRGGDEEANCGVNWVLMEIAA